MANATAVAQDVQDVYFVRLSLFYWISLDIDSTHHPDHTTHSTFQMEFLILGSISFASAFGLCCYQI